MMENANTVIAAMRALVNELENVKALPDEQQDERHHAYQSDLEDALNELIAAYSRHREVDRVGSRVGDNDSGVTGRVGDAE